MSTAGLVVHAFLLGAFLVLCTWAQPASAMTVTVSRVDHSLVGESVTFRTVVTEAAVGDLEYKYDFGDGTPSAFVVGRQEMSHTYTERGRYSVNVLVQDANGTLASDPGLLAVHYPPLPGKPSVSSDIVYDEKRSRIYNVNRDNDSITAIDPVSLTKVGEAPVFQGPEALAIAPDGKIWVIHRDDYAVAIVDPNTLKVEGGFRLPYASQPMGVAMSPMHDAAYITLMATGRLLKLDPSSGSVVGDLDVGSHARGVTVSQDGQNVYVTRFISSDIQGEIVEVDGPSFTVRRRFPLPIDTTTMDTDQKARGVPNYIFSVALSPDGRQAWIPSKKDNIRSGMFREGVPLNGDDTVRPMLSILDLNRDIDQPPVRVDFDDRNLPTHVEFDSLGGYAFVSLTGSNRIEVRDALKTDFPFVTSLTDSGLAPRGIVFGPNNRLFVHGSLERKIVVYDVNEIVTLVSNEGKRLADIPTVDHEKLDAQILRGKQIFFNSADGRMTNEGYLSCASCHFDGDGDGRVWDFTSRGEGLRNTTALLGRRGMGHGPVHWSGNFDEIQDFENEIRELFGGDGFLSEDVFATHDAPLGSPRKGVNEELDALAAFVTSLDHVNPSPFRNRDGTMTAAALAGKTIFTRLGCDFCHGGADFTDSARGLLHDVGTITPASGTRSISGARSTEALLGIDTPTLLGIWETAPYLHDGSAATLRDVLIEKNPSGLHGFTSTLTSQQVDQLVAYLNQIDNELPIRRLPFDGPIIGGCACELASRADVEPGRGAAPWLFRFAFICALLAPVVARRRHGRVQRHARRQGSRPAERAR
ncbi:MAG: PKD domain-containing protein [Myxococcales bacterium]